MRKIAAVIDSYGFTRDVFSIGATEWVAQDGAGHVFVSRNFVRKQFHLAETIAAGWMIGGAKQLSNQFFDTPEQAVRHLESIETFTLGAMIDGK